jgi:hypothetical protein
VIAPETLRLLDQIEADIRADRARSANARKRGRRPGRPRPKAGVVNRLLYDPNQYVKQSS